MSLTFAFSRRIFLGACGSLVLMLLASCGRDHPDLPRPSVRYVYEFGVPVQFRLGGDATRFEMSGWGDPEAAGTWTTAVAASLVFRITSFAEPLELTMTLSAFVPRNTGRPQPVIVYANAQEIARWEVGDERATYKAKIPTSVRRTDLLFIDLYVPHAVAPADTGDSSDQRRLGVLCHDLTIVPSTATAFAGSFTVRFKLGGGSEPYRLNGWSWTESDATWTTGAAAQLRLPAPKQTGPLLLHLRAGGMVRPPDLPAQSAEVFANGQKIADWEVPGPAADYEATIPAEALNNADAITLEFRTPHAASPKQLGQSEDARVLGLRFYELTLSPK